MAKGARASVLKKNKSALKKKVFGPVELARNQRLSAKLMELARAPKPPREEMETEQTEVNKTEEAEAKSGDNTMDVDDTAAANKDAKSRSTGASSDKKSGRIQKSRHRRTRNELTFRKHPMKKAKKEKARKR